VARRIEVEHLVGATEIAERAGVRRPQVVHDWRRRHDDFPEPLTTIGGALVWDWREVERWLERTGRLE
jgi:predicted DNA-binding transcriptional regulator AlpA